MTDDTAESLPSRRTARGPMVTRWAKVGGAFAILGPVQFVIAMAVVQYHYPGYSLLMNSVSDLGNPDLSPWYWLFNDSIRVLGVLGVTSAVLLLSAFRPRLVSRLGLVCVMIASAGAFAVGTFPENSPQLNGSIHGIASLVTFLFAGIALIVLSVAMVRDTRWDRYRLYTLISGIVTLVAMVLYAVGFYPLLGPGGMERLTIAPILLWSVVVGIHVLRMQTYVRSSGADSSSLAASG